MDHLVEVYEVSYVQRSNLAGGITETDVTLTTLWNRPAQVPEGCTLGAIVIPESLANEICE